MNLYELAKNFSIAAITMENNFEDIRTYKQHSDLTPVNYSKKEIFNTLYDKFYKSVFATVKCGIEVKTSTLMNYLEK